jgi:outer membrane lipoprotein-sorting protein
MTQLRRLFAVLLLTFVLPGAASAALANQDMADISRAEQYLNHITTLKARFLQVSSNGAQAEGVAYLSRPGKMRLDYLPPNPIQVFARDGMLVYYDRQLQQTSYVDVDQTPAGVLVRAQIRLVGGDITVTAVRHGKGTLELDMVRSRDPGAGSITLIFEERPFALKQWRVRDPQGQVTTVSLFDAQTGITLDPSIFHFVDPQFRPNLDKQP